VPGVTPAALIQLMQYVRKHELKQASVGHIVGPASAAADVVATLETH
jgi:hypothetical protein